MPFTDIDSNFELDATGDIKVLTDTDAINQSLKNILLTPTGFRPGEYQFNDTYGIGMRDYLFEKTNEFTASNMREVIVEKINFYEPRINLKSVNVRILNENTYRVDIDYVLIAGNRDINEFRLLLDRL